MKNAILKQLYIVSSVVLLTLSVYSQNTEYRYIQIPVNIDEEVIQSPFFLYVKYASYDKKVDSLEESTNLKDAFIYQAWKLLSENDQENLNEITLSKSERSLNFIKFLLNDFGNELSDHDRITERFDIGDVSIYILHIVNANGFFPLIIKGDGSEIVIDFEAQGQPFFQMLPNIYNHPELRGINLIVENESPFNYYIELPIYDEFPVNDSVYLCFNATLLDEPAKASEIAINNRDNITGIMPRYAHVMQKIKQNRHNDQGENKSEKSLDIMSEKSLAMLNENLSNMVGDRSDPVFMTDLIDSFVPDFPVRFIVENENIAYYYLLSEKENPNETITERTLLKFESGWKLVNLFTAGAIYDKFKYIREVQEQYLQIANEKPDKLDMK